MIGARASTSDKVAGVPDSPLTSRFFIQQWQLRHWYNRTGTALHVIGQHPGHRHRCANNVNCASDRNG